MHTELDPGLATIHSRLERLANSVCVAVDEVVGAFMAWDQGRMYQVMLNDLPINRDARAIDALCHQILEGRAFTGIDTRFLISTLRMTVALERIGDYAVTVARVGVRLSELPARYIAEEVTGLAVNACHMLQDSIDAFVRRDVELARDTSRRAKTIDGRHNRLFQELVDGGDTSLSGIDMVSLLTIISRLERVSDQAKNICEETLFVALGETKRPKVYRVLFVDESNELYAPLAVHLARQQFPGSGDYSHAALQPGGSLSPLLQQEPGVGSSEIGAKQTESAAECISRNDGFHVVVCLEAGEPIVLPTVGFRTVVLRWSVDAQHGISALKAHLISEIDRLMTTLRGVNAT